MTDFINDLDSLQKVFLGCAVFGGLLFILRTLWALIGGGDHDGHGDTGLDDHSGFHGSDTHDQDSSDSFFRFLSLQSLTAFIMMFGLVGLALSKQSHIAAWGSVSGGFLAGVLAIWVLGTLMKGVAHLQSDGTMIPEHIVGCAGSVYLNIPPGGTGKVQASVDGSLREFSARAVHGESLKTGQPVQVVSVARDGVLTVMLQEKS